LFVKAKYLIRIALFPPFWGGRRCLKPHLVFQKLSGLLGWNPTEREREEIIAEQKQATLVEPVPLDASWTQGESEAGWLLVKLQNCGLI
jgi:hypothetical protein